MRKKIIGIFVCMLLIATTLSVAKTETQENQTPLANGITFGQVDFLFSDEVQKDSHWGHLDIKVQEFLEQYQYEKGFFNVYTDAGWVVQNHLIDDVENMEQMSIYFDLGVKPGEDIEQISAYMEFLPEPVVGFQDGPRYEFDVATVMYNAEGLSDISPSIPGYIEELEFIPSGSTYDFTKPNLNENENVQCAKNQCAPMGVANSLQYLENRNSLFFQVPHDHEMGLYGDDTLVGQLDTHMGRSTTSRDTGPGVMADDIFIGKFQYLADNGLSNSLIHRHQGSGYFDMPSGDFTHAGITSDDQSVDGKITFDWIEEQLRNCEDVEVAIKWGSGGGHVVRIFGCGKTLGQPYLRYKHDRLQTHHDSTDTQGLEEAQVYVSDLDGDGLMNWGSAGNEIVLAISESVQPLVFEWVLHPIHMFIFGTVFNYAEFDMQEIVWSIEADGFVPYGKLHGGILNIPAGGQEQIQTDIMLGLGPTSIKAMVSLRGSDVILKAECFLLGPIILGMREI